MSEHVCAVCGCGMQPVEVCDDCLGPEPAEQLAEADAAIARLTRERDEALADRDGWKTLAHGYEDELSDVEETLGAGDGEGAIEAVKRTVRERDEARALREQAITREEHWYAECQTALRECERLRAAWHAPKAGT
jgi:hypothetical protein